MEAYEFVKTALVVAVVFGSIVECGAIWTQGRSHHDAPTREVSRSCARQYDSLEQRRVCAFR
jgi:hypothetical protein